MPCREAGIDMTKTFTGWSLKRWCWGWVALAPLLYLCVRYLDVPVALLVQGVLYGDSSWARHTSDLPDLLLPLVVVATVVSAVLHQVRKRRGIHDRLDPFFLLVAWTAPGSFLAKGVLKQLFGRVNTRVWLENQRLYDFHWFRGGEGFEGFPSGHMLVLVALAAVFWRFFPGARVFFGGMAVLLAAALIATNYHFVSDVIAGGYLAVGIEGLFFGVIAARRGATSGCPER